MPAVHRSPLALQDYRDIWRYIAAHSIDAADRLLQRIDSKLDLYAANPEMGRRRDELRPGFRSFPVGNYVIFYRITADGIEVIRVLHGARDFRRLF